MDAAENGVGGEAGGKEGEEYQKKGKGRQVAMMKERRGNERHCRGGGR